MVLIQTPVTGLPYEFMRPLRSYTYWELVIVLTGAVLGGLIARYRWRGAGLLGYLGLFSMIAGYLVYAITVSIPLVPPDRRWLSYLLLVAEAGGLTLILVFTFYTLDAATRRRWQRRPDTTPYDPDHMPVMAAIVPCFNEPADMLEGTVRHLVEQDYPRDRFLVVVADDSTDPDLVAKNQAMCERLGAHHVRRPDRRGFKAGAINYVESILADEVELMGIVDADYWVSPDWMSSLAGYFIDPRLSFVQTPQDYRNLDESFLTRRYKRAEAYFYHGIMPSRNEENTIIFCGTMGILRRSALKDAGGFAEDQICEDAEVSVRLAVKGWRSLYIDQSFGKGLMPAVFEAYKKQFHRWAFGNVRIMFAHTGTILRSRMTRRQKLDYMVSNLHWFDGAFVMAIALILLYLGLGAVLGYDAVTHHQRELALLALVPAALLIDGLVRLHLVLGLTKRVSFKETLLVQGMWFAIKFTNLVAVIKCMLGFKTPFVRTPKSPGHRLSIPHAAFRAIRLTKIETLIGLTLLVVAGFNAHPDRILSVGPGALLLPLWLTLYGVFFLCAPAYAYLSYRTLARKPVTTVRPIKHPSRVQVRSLRGARKGTLTAQARRRKRLPQ